LQGLANATLANCTFAANPPAPPTGHETAVIAVDYGSTSTLQNSILAFGEGGRAIECLGPDYGAALTCCNLYGNTDGDWVGCIADQYGMNGNISVDPLFCDAFFDELTVLSRSPCLPGNHPDGYDCGLIGAFGEGCSDPTAVERASWGDVKKMWR